MVEQGSSDGVINGILMHGSCIKAHWVYEHNAVEGNRYKLQTKACHFSEHRHRLRQQTVIDDVLRRYCGAICFARHRKNTCQYDNVHTHSVTRDFLHQNNIKFMSLPAINPNLNPFEHL